MLHHSVADFLSMLLGGPNSYKGRSMQESHKHMPIQRKQFDGVWSHMERSFLKHKVTPEQIAQIKEAIYSFTKDIINKPG